MISERKFLRISVSVARLENSCTSLLTPRRIWEKLYPTMLVVDFSCTNMRENGMRLDRSRTRAEVYKERI